MARQPAEGSAVGPGPPISYTITRLARAIRRDLRTMDELGLSGPQVAALLALRDEAGISGAELARRCYVTAQAMHEVVLELEQRGLIRRSRHATNKRVRLTELTTAGTELLATWELGRLEMEQRLLDGLSDGETRQLRALLVRAAGNMGLGR